MREKTPKKLTDKQVIKQQRQIIEHLTERLMVACEEARNANSMTKRAIDLLERVGLSTDKSQPTRTN